VYWPNWCIFNVVMFIALVCHFGFRKLVTTAPKLDEEAWVLDSKLFLGHTGIPQQDRRTLYKQKNYFLKRRGLSLLCNASKINCITYYNLTHTMIQEKQLTTLLYNHGFLAVQFISFNFTYLPFCRTTSHSFLIKKCV
jgi:hypothetical protein